MNIKSMFQTVGKVGAAAATGLLPFTTYAFQPGFNADPGPFAGVSAEPLPIALITAANYFLGIVGLIAAIMFVYGGFRYIIAAGDEDAAETAKKTMLYALIGLIVIGLSYSVIRFVTAGFA